MRARTRCKALIVNVLNVLIHGPNQRTIFIRIFRVLHTVQFSRFSVVVLNSNSFILSQRCLFVNNFFYFFQLLYRSFTPSLEASIIISKVFQKVNNFFHFFSTFFLPGIRQQNGVVHLATSHKIRHSISYMPSFFFTGHCRPG